MPFKWTKEPTRIRMNLTDFGLRISATGRGILRRQVDIKWSLHLARIYFLDWDDTHGRHLLCSRFMTPDLTSHNYYFALSPGRFFAVNEAKALFAYIIVTYDFKFEEGQGVPPMSCVGELRSRPGANVMFRTRQK